ncbi:hypothetical protein L6Q96_16120 [Candidatus Binatia bacterium]|nr:hypothetical protein [Candidatus Binatia bacterium]
MRTDLWKRLDRLETLARRAVTLPPDDPADRERDRAFWQDIVDAYPVPDPDPSAALAMRVAAATACHPDLRADLEGLAAHDGPRGELGRRLLWMAERVAPAPERAP